LEADNTLLDFLSIIGLASLISFHTADIDAAAIFIELYRIAASPILIAIPLFTFAGFILANGKTPERLARLSQALLGRIPGGIPLVVLGCLCLFYRIHRGIWGDHHRLGWTTLPPHAQGNVPKRFFFRPNDTLRQPWPSISSLPLILYALMAHVSVDQLFLAGIVPGLLMIFILSLYRIKKSRTFKINTHPFNKDEALCAIGEARWGIPLPIIILVGIYSGIFTVTEAAAITVFYVVVIAIWVNKDLHPIRNIPRLMRNSMVLVDTILIILGTAMGFTNYLIDEQIPMKILDIMKQHIDNKVTFLILLNIFLLVVGCIVDIFSAIIVVVPLVISIAQS